MSFKKEMLGQSLFDCDLLVKFELKTSTFRMLFKLQIAACNKFKSESAFDWCSEYSNSNLVNGIKAICRAANCWRNSVGRSQRLQVSAQRDGSLCSYSVRASGHLKWPLGHESGDFELFNILKLLYLDTIFTILIITDRHPYRSTRCGREFWTGLH